MKDNWNKRGNEIFLGYYFFIWKFMIRVLCVKCGENWFNGSFKLRISDFYKKILFVISRVVFKIVVVI